MKYLLTAVALALAACAPGPGPSTPAPQFNAAQSCAAQGGHMERVGRAQTEQCVIPFADAGRVCRDGGECQGDCIGDVQASGQSNVSGQCQARNMRFGCYTTIVNGRAQSAICVD